MTITVTAAHYQAAQRYVARAERDANSAIAHRVAAVTMLRDTDGAFVAKRDLAETTGLKPATLDVYVHAAGVLIAAGVNPDGGALTRPIIDAYAATYSLMMSARRNGAAYYGGVRERASEYAADLDVFAERVAALAEEATAERKRDTAKPREDAAVDAPSQVADGSESPTAEPDAELTRVLSALATARALASSLTPGEREIVADAVATFAAELVSVPVAA